MNITEQMLEIGDKLGQAKATMEQLRERLKEKDDLIKALLAKLDIPAAEQPTKSTSKEEE